VAISRSGLTSKPLQLVTKARLRIRTAQRPASGKLHIIGREHGSERRRAEARGDGKVPSLKMPQPNQ
jgi:hypothetical protein